jgi:NADH-quinone oxidoreductase subunit J
MTEVNLFLLVGIISVVSAVMMLLSENAVHSALFLILIMVCIAFLFLMLNAPFLAMIQITVYAGAIMVLFLFVIMLLGAEKLGTRSARLRWITPVAVFLSVLFLITAGLAIGQGQVNLSAAPSTEPMLRVAHFAPEAGNVDIYANGELIASNVEYRRSTDFVKLPAGEYNIAVFSAGTQDALTAVTVTLEAGFAGTAIAYGTDSVPQVALEGEDLSTVPERSGRLTVFNGFSGVPAISVVDFGSDFDAEDTQVIMADIPQDTLSEPVIVGEATDFRSWAIVEAGNMNNVLFRLNNPDMFNVKRDTSKFLIVSTEPQLGGTVRAQTVALDTTTAAGFGGPLAMGQALFTRYMLPMQMVAVLLLVAMIGAIVLTHKPKDVSSIERRALGRRKVSRPLTSVLSAQTGRDVYVPDTNGTSDEALPEAVGEEEKV